MEFNYDVIVIGAGHAGCEAAAAAANLGSKTCLITMDMNKIAQMSCNPAVGGIAKGQIVREIDALGGFTGLVTDRTAIQFRLLNRSKGPAMWSPRAQCDRNKFIWAWREVLENTPNLHIWQDTVRQLLVEDGEVRGVLTVWGVTFRAKCVVLTAGTFLNGLMHIGRVMLPGGRISEPASYELTESIAQHGIEYGRMKTGTPVRIDGRSVHYEDMEAQDGENDFHKFSFLDTGIRPLPQLPCWSCFTNEAVHEVLRKGLPDSPLFNGQIQSIGPRYCPSIETKIVTFPDKPQHQLFLEPEGETTQEYYLNGFSSSLPMDIQIEALKQIPAFRDLVIYRPGYAIEYDYFDPTQLKHTLESKKVKNFFLAGQVNGTTGYEEAAGQGIIAGINAHINCHGGDAFTLGRNEAYTHRGLHPHVLHQTGAYQRLPRNIGHHSPSPRLQVGGPHQSSPSDAEEHCRTHPGFPTRVGPLDGPQRGNHRSGRNPPQVRGLYRSRTHHCRQAGTTGSHQNQRTLRLQQPAVALHGGPAETHQD